MNIEQVEIGASEASRPLGLSKYETRLQFWARKTKRADPPDETEAMRLGNFLEPALARIFENEYEVPLHKAETLYHPRLPWLRSTADYYFKAEEAPGKLREEMQLDDGERVLVEIKSSGLASFYDRHRMEDQWGEPGSDHIPVEYATQVQTQIFVMNESLQLFGDGYCSRAFVKALLAGHGCPTYRVIGRPDVQNWIERSLSNFVHDYLVEDIPPPPQSLEDWELSEELVRQPMRGKEPREATAEETALVQTWAFAKTAREQAKLMEAQARTKLVEAIKDSYGIKGPWGKVIYTAGKETAKLSKAAAFDAIMEMAEKSTAPWAAAIRQIRDDFTKTGFTGRQLRPFWTKQEESAK